MDTDAGGVRRSTRARPPVSYAGWGSEMASSGDEYIVDEEEEEEEEDDGSGNDCDVDDDDDDISSKDVLKKFNFATSAVKCALEGITEQCVPNVKVVDLCLLGDTVMTEQIQSCFKKSKGMKKGIAFPTCISVNNKVCNVSPVLSDTTVLAENDVVRIEMSAHIDGFMATVAHTILVTDKTITGTIAKVIAAANKARKEMVLHAQPGIKKEEAFDATKLSVGAFGCKIVQLKCCQLKQFHMDGSDWDTFQLNKVYSVELIVSSKKTSLVEMDGHADVYKLLPEDKIQFSEDIPRSYVIINQKFQQMSFNNRALADLGIQDITPLRSAGMHQSCPILCVKDGVDVVHFKFTMYVRKNGAVNKTYQKVQKLSLDRAVVLGREKGDEYGERSLIYCGKLPVGDRGSGVTLVVNDISWNLHKLYKKEKVLACTGSFGTIMYRRPNAVDGPLEDLEKHWSKVKLCSIAGKLCE